MCVQYEKIMCQMNLKIYLNNYQINLSFRYVYYFRYFRYFL